MMRKWMIGALVAVGGVGGVAAAGHVYVDGQLRQGVDDGLAAINDFYGGYGWPPLTYERVDTDVLARSVSIFGLRQEGTVAHGSQQQQVRLAIARMDVAPAEGEGLDIVYEDVSSLTTTAPAQGTSSEDAFDAASVDVAMTAAKGGMTGVQVDRLGANHQDFGLFGWYTASNASGVSLTVTVPGTAPVSISIADLSMTSDAEGSGKIVLTDVAAKQGTAQQVMARFRPSDALGPLVRLASQIDGEPTAEQQAMLQALLGDYGKSLAGFSVKGLNIDSPYDDQRVQLREVALDELSWQGDVPTAFVFRMDGLRSQWPEDLDVGARRMLVGVGLGQPTVSTMVSLHFDPAAGVLRLAPLSVTVDDFVAASLTLTVDEVGGMIDEGPTAAPLSPRAVKSRLQETVLSAVPQGLDFRLEDLGGIKALVAVLAEQQDVPTAQVAMGLALQGSQMIEPVVGREVAKGLFGALAAFLTDKDVLILKAESREGLPLGLLVSRPPAEALSISTAAE